MPNREESWSRGSQSKGWMKKVAKPGRVHQFAWEVVCCAIISSFCFWLLVWKRKGVCLSKMEKSAKDEEIEKGDFGLPTRSLFLRFCRTWGKSKVITSQTTVTQFWKGVLQWGVAMSDILNAPPQRPLPRLWVLGNTIMAYVKFSPWLTHDKIAKSITSQTRVTCASRIHHRILVVYPVNMCDCRLRGDYFALFSSYKNLRPPFRRECLERWEAPLEYNPGKAPELEFLAIGP